MILDSFAGSGTTAHAVLNMNKADGGHRKFILVEMGDYADTITAERVKRVIMGYGEGKNAVEGTGGSFSYYELGEPLLLPSGNLNEKVGTEKIRTTSGIPKPKSRCPTTRTATPISLARTTALPTISSTNPEGLCAELRLCGNHPGKGRGYIIYADRCTLSEQELQQLGITFKKIPRDIVRV